MHLGPANLTDLFEHPILDFRRIQSAISLFLCGGDSEMQARSHKRHILEAGESLKGRTGILYHKNESVHKSMIALRGRPVSAGAALSLDIKFTAA
ncbi:hypothetical protein AciPR4_0387 [Terriglobus saanensis SP1PR4]|uniref:Uncharacterized protein n=1 Tax=Terriglobus saanensis (strain ATCC BAA-1853 / DSM 23119 / SP1PR4) TaxID=401053 RepID=E8V289_TERSS|nr:hypothetical protein AciPR4_0387 [Terriglobus saanensis SP1PR4]